MNDKGHGKTEARHGLISLNTNEIGGLAFELAKYPQFKTPLKSMCCAYFKINFRTAL